jgi:hypothetical protein
MNWYAIVYKAQMGEKSCETIKNKRNRFTIAPLVTQVRQWSDRKKKRSAAI